MMRVDPFRVRAVSAACVFLGAGAAHALTFDFQGGTSNFDSTISIGTGIRMRNPDCSLINVGATGSGAPAGCLATTSALGDQGDLNYAKGDAFTTYIKGSSELLLKLPEDFTFLGRVNWLADASATKTTGYLSATSPRTGLTDGLAPDARRDLKFTGRLLDFWVSKSFSIGEEQARVRVGNQVISWGESLFLPGGINSINAIDVMRAAQPGTQLKEVFLPAPIVSVSSGLGHGLNAEAYVQPLWNGNYLPPTGSYWSDANGLGRGHDAYGLVSRKPGNGGEWGAALRYEPEGTPLNLGLYVLNYNDKGPQFSTNVAGTGAAGWEYAKNRRLYGISANFPVGDVAVGTELSYRPRDAVALNSAVDGCAGENGKCWVDKGRLQWHLTGLLSLTPNTGGIVLRALGADTATLMAEAVVISYPGLKSGYNGELLSAGSWGWGQQYSATASPRSEGTATSSGFNFDFSWVYDGTLIPGWQVVPEVYYFQALSGRTPNSVGLFMEGAKSTNFVVSLLQNPTKWQFAANYTAFWGGSTVYDQPYRDRNFLGLTLSRNF